jgi:hypothetical protein
LHPREMNEKEKVVGIKLRSMRNYENISTIKGFTFEKKFGGSIPNKQKVVKTASLNPFEI